MRLVHAALILALAASLLTPPAPSAAAPSSTEIVALVVEGAGFGHGRGMSQWGSYGRAVSGNQTWQQILDAYYGGTTLSTASTSSRVRVRLVAHDGASVVGVISSTKRAIWNGVGYSALQARFTATPNRYDIWAAPSAVCPTSATTGWTRIATAVAGPITFTTTVSESSGFAGDVLGLCTGGCLRRREAGRSGTTRWSQVTSVDLHGPATGR